MKNAIKIILLCFLLSGCAGGLVCRHKVLSHYAFAIEQHVPARIVVWKVTNPLEIIGIGDAHAQLQIQKGGKWIYLQEIMGFLIETEVPEIPQDGLVLWFSIEEYLKALEVGQYHQKEAHHGNPQ